MRIPRTAAALVTLLALGPVAAGCTSDDNSSSDKRGERSPAAKAPLITRTLSGIPAAAAETSVTYYHTPTARELVAKDRKLYRNLSSMGIQELVEEGYRGTPMSKEYGFDDKDVETAVQLTGDPSSSRLTGTFDPDAVTRAMAGQGYGSKERGGAAHLEKPGEDASFDVSSGVRVRNGDDAGGNSDGIRLGTSAPTVALADDEVYAEVLACLGDVYQATFYGKRNDHGVRLVAIGGLLDADGNPSEKLCVKTASREAAQDAGDRLREKTGSGHRYAGSSVSIGKGSAPLITMTWRNREETGLRPMDHNMTGELHEVLYPRGA